MAEHPSHRPKTHKPNCKLGKTRKVKAEADLYKKTHFFPALFERSELKNRALDEKRIVMNSVRCIENSYACFRFNVNFVSLVLLALPVVGTLLVLTLHLAVQTNKASVFFALLLLIAATDAFSIFAYLIKIDKHIKVFKRQSLGFQEDVAEFQENLERFKPIEKLVEVHKQMLKLLKKK